LALIQVITNSATRQILRLIFTYCLNTVLLWYLIAQPKLMSASDTSKLCSSSLVMKYVNWQQLVQKQSLPRKLRSWKWHSKWRRKWDSNLMRSNQSSSHILLFGDNVRIKELSILVFNCQHCTGHSCSNLIQPYFLCRSGNDLAKIWLPPQSCKVLPRSDCSICQASLDTRGEAERSDRLFTTSWQSSIQSRKAKLCLLWGHHQWGGCSFCCRRGQE